MPVDGRRGRAPTFATTISSPRPATGSRTSGGAPTASSPIGHVIGTTEKSTLTAHYQIGRSALHAELMGYVRTLFDRKGITHQPAMWGKTSRRGSGSTVLPYFTRHGMNGLDVSIPVLSMHAPFEVVSKADLYEGYRGYRAFLGD